MNFASRSSLLPHVGRTVTIAPNLHINLAAVGHPLALMQPKTKLGAVALDLALSTSTALISITAISAYVFALTQASAPQLQFQAPPPGTKISPQSLQQSYDQFLTQLATFQGQAAAWINTQPGTGSASIFSSLVSVPAVFNAISSQVHSDFTLLSSLPPGSPAYQQTMTQLTNLIGAESQPIASLVQQMQTLGTNLGSAANTLVTASTTGVLAQLQQAYASEIAALQQAINTATSEVNSDNQKIIGLGFAAGAAIVVGLIGLANIWNPLGWILMAAGGVGAYFAITEIATLKAQIASLKSQIQADELWQQADSTAAAAVASFATQLQGFAQMNSAAQQELTELENLYQTLGSDIATALTELSDGDLAAAQNEWNDIVSAASVLANVTAYIWPNPILLPNPTTFAAAGGDVYAVVVSGQVYRYAAGGNTWTALPGMSLSVVAAGSQVVGIDGAPADGSQISNPYPTNYTVKTFNAAADNWTSISTFPAAQIATDGTTIYAINQNQNSRQAYQYTGSGTAWTGLASLPNSDAAGQIAVAGGKLVCIANNSAKAYVYGNLGWSALGSATYSSMTANGTKVAFIDSGNNGWLYDASSGSLASTITSVTSLAQVPNGDQYAISTGQALYYVNNQGNAPAATLLKQSAIGVSVSDTGNVYYTDNLGNAYILTDLQTNAWQLLPAFPSPGN